MSLGTYDADHPLIQRPDTVLAWVKPTSIDFNELMGDLYSCLTDPHMGGDLDSKCVYSILAEYGIVEETT